LTDPLSNAARLHAELPEAGVEICRCAAGTRSGRRGRDHYRCQRQRGRR
jgi:hypothetical protein